MTAFHPTAVRIAGALPLAALLCALGSPSALAAPTDNFTMSNFSGASTGMGAVTYDNFTMSTDATSNFTMSGYTGTNFTMSNHVGTNFTMIDVTHDNFTMSRDRSTAVARD